MGGIVSKVTDAVGLTNTKAKKAAAANATAAIKAATALSKEQIELAKEELAINKEYLEFNKAQYNDWKAVYGDLQENLSEYYKNLTPEKITALGLQNQQREFQATTKAVRQSFAQRGLSESGIETAILVNSAFQNAEARATIRTNAEQQVAEQKIGFLGVGLGQGTAFLGNVNSAVGNLNNAGNIANNAYSNASGIRANSANNYLSASANIGMNNTNNVGQLIGSIAGFSAGG